MRLPFIDPSNPTHGGSEGGSEGGRGDRGAIGIELVERRVTSVEELRIGLNALKVHEADAFFYTNDRDADQELRVKGIFDGEIA